MQCSKTWGCLFVGGLVGSRLVANMVILVGLCWVLGCVGGRNDFR